ncbi:hypothetical protein BJX99DRAFT_230627 [Aspergillus californicus]
MAPNDATSSSIDIISSSNESRGLDELTFYPAFCFKASPTHFAWVKMSATDVLRLQRRMEFGDQGLFFYQNHPIRFVNLVGIIVARVDVPRRTILTLDDSSGAVIDVVVLKADNHKGYTTAPVPVKSHGQAPDEDDEQRKNTETHLTASAHAPLDISPLQPGKLFQIKGTLSVFRSTVQVNLERFFSVADTKAEMRFVEERCRFLVEVLSVPWVLGEGDIARVRFEADEDARKVEEEQARGRKRVRRRAEREERDRRKIEKRWEQEEVMREKEAKSAREVGGEFTRGIRRQQI